MPLLIESNFQEIDIIEYEKGIDILVSKKFNRNDISTINKQK